MSSTSKVGGDRVKSETVAVNQVWCREGRSGTHFIITWIGYAHPSTVTTFTVETRKVQKVRVSTLLSKKNSYKVVGYLSGCKCCKTVPKVRYGRVNGELLYRVACDCLEFDGQSPDMDRALRTWRSNMKYLGSPESRHRPGREGIIPRARASA